MFPSNFSLNRMAAPKLCHPALRQKREYLPTAPIRGYIKQFTLSSESYWSLTQGPAENKNKTQPN